jgi:hypothetical protein
MPRKKKIDTEALAAALMDIPEVDKEVRKRLPALLQRMFDIAEGVFIQEERYGEDGPMVRVYRMAPDRLALQFLIENVIGKTPQRLELTGKGGGPMEVVPWAPLTQMEAAGLLPEGGQVVEGVYSVIGEGEGDANHDNS